MDAQSPAATIPPTPMKHYRSCNLCEAICGLEITHDGNAILSIKGDKEDPFSHGHICPKAVALEDIYKDPDRLKKPVKRTGNGWEEISWQQAFDEIGEKLAPIRQEYGNNAVAVYLGNPTVHSLGALTFNRPFIKALRTQNIFTATSVDQLPHHFAASFMFGHTMMLPIPDIDRTDHMLILGANPGASNGSLMTAPGMDRRLRAIRERGGRVVLIDPRRTETAKLADEHHFIRPGSDVMFLAALLNVIFEHGLDRPDRLSADVVNLQELRRAAQGVTPAIAASHTGIPASTLVQIARDFASSDRAVCYGRMGLSTQAHGGLCQWLVNALNIVTGNLDRAGGAMFTLPAIDLVGKRNTIGKAGRWKSRVRGQAEFDGDLPVAVMAEEILVEGDGKVRALFTSAGNPVLSTPNGTQLEKALEGLDFMVSIDIYINETTRHADIILPPATGLETDHYDLVFNALAVRNIAKFSPALFKPASGGLYDWQILQELTRRVVRPAGSLMGRVRQAMRLRILGLLTPARIVDLGLRLGPYGAWRSPLKLLSGLKLKRLKKSPHGIDLGPLEPRLPDGLRTPDRKVDVAPRIFLDRLGEVLAEFAGAATQDESGMFRLIGRRHVRSNNSWMHNSVRLTKGKTRCTLMMHPDDAAELGLAEQDNACIRSRTGAITLPVEVTENIMPGVVSIPHGYGHNRKGARLSVAGELAGESVNDITDDRVVDELTGNAAFSGQLVKVSPEMESNAGPLFDD